MILLLYINMLISSSRFTLYLELLNSVTLQSQCTIMYSPTNRNLRMLGVAVEQSRQNGKFTTSFFLLIWTFPRMDTHTHTHTHTHTQLEILGSPQLIYFLYIHRQKNLCYVNWILILIFICGWALLFIFLSSSPPFLFLLPLVCVCVCDLKNKQTLCYSRK
jgi:hypothetical protein